MPRIPINIADHVGRTPMVRLTRMGAPEGRPWHRSEIHRARVLAQLFATVLTGATAVRLATAEAA